VKFLTNEVKIRRVGSHDTVDSRGVGASNVVLLNETTELRVVADSLNDGDGEDSEKRENPVSSISRD
jgi:hypothetical protein